MATDLFSSPSIFLPTAWIVPLANTTTTLTKQIGKYLALVILGYTFSDDQQQHWFVPFMFLPQTQQTLWRRQIWWFSWWVGWITHVQKLPLWLLPKRHFQHWMYCVCEWAIWRCCSTNKHLFVQRLWQRKIFRSTRTINMQRLSCWAVWRHRWSNNHYSMPRMPR